MSDLRLVIPPAAFDRIETFLATGQPGTIMLHVGPAGVTHATVEAPPPSKAKPDA
jgi:hypothetical protein